MVTMTPQLLLSCWKGWCMVAPLHFTVPQSSFAWQMFLIFRKSLWKTYGGIKPHALTISTSGLNNNNLHISKALGPQSQITALIDYFLGPLSYIINCNILTKNCCRIWYQMLVSSLKMCKLFYFANVQKCIIKLYDKVDDLLYSFCSICGICFLWWICRRIHQKYWTCARNYVLKTELLFKTTSHTVTQKDFRPAA